MAAGSHLYPPNHSRALWGSTLGLYGALWGSTVGLINPGHDLVTNSTHLFDGQQMPTPEKVRTYIELIETYCFLFLVCVSVDEVRFAENLEKKLLAPGKLAFEMRGCFWSVRKLRNLSFVVIPYQGLQKRSLKHFIATVSVLLF